METGDRAVFFAGLLQVDGEDRLPIVETILIDQHMRNLPGPGLLLFIPMCVFRGAALGIEPEAAALGKVGLKLTVVSLVLKLGFIVLK